MYGRRLIIHIYQQVENLYTTQCG